MRKLKPNKLRLGVAIDQAMPRLAISDEARYMIDLFADMVDQVYNIGTRYSNDIQVVWSQQ